MIHDEPEIAMLRKASDITVQAFMESAKAVREEMTTQQIAAIVNFTFEYEHGGMQRGTLAVWFLHADRMEDRRAIWFEVDPV